MNFLEKSLRSLIPVYSFQGGFEITTTTMLATGEMINLTVTGGDTECVVSDQGLAIRELEIAGASIKKPSLLLRPYASRYGVEIKDAALSCRVPTEYLFAAIVSVSNACRDTFNEELKKIKNTNKIDIRRTMDKFFKENIPDFVAHKQKISGANKSYVFDYVFMRRSSSKMITVDPVLPEAASINSRIVANIDVKKELGDDVSQFFVIDDSEQQWTSDKLGLLRLTENTIIPISKIGRSLIPMLQSFQSSTIN